MKNYHSLLEYTEKLARLKIPDNERDEYATQLGRILQFVEKLDELNTENIDPTNHILMQTNVVRDDKVKDSLPREKFLKVTPEHTEDSLVVPAIIKQD